LRTNNYQHVPTKKIGLRTYCVHVYVRSPDRPKFATSRNIVSRASIHPTLCLFQHSPFGTPQKPPEPASIICAEAGSGSSALRLSPSHGPKKKPMARQSLREVSQFVD
jgi:hypothetical protein